MNRTVNDFVYVGFNRQVIALDRYTGEIIWDWKAPKSGFTSLLLDGDRLIVSVNGYMYCLEPLHGDVVWTNELKGYGVGIATMASAAGSTGAAGGAAQAQQQAAAAAGAAAASSAAAGAAASG